MDKNQRIKHIVNTLQVKNAISIKNLMKEFDVSEMTVRRDLSLLADDGIVELIPGGAILKTDAERDEERYLITHEETRRTREKVKIGKQEKTILKINEMESSVVRKIFNLALNDIGLLDIARILNKEGIRTRAGKKWEKTSIHWILTNHVYTGTLVFRAKGEEIRVEGAFNPILSKETFEEVQEILHKKSPEISICKKNGA